MPSEPWRRARSGSARAAAVWSALAACAALALAASLALGSVRLDARQLVDALLRRADPLAMRIVWDLRMPRALTGFACGALLATAGALYQVLLRNPLADPYVLGVSGGAAVCALFAMLLSWPVWGVNASAFAGALLATALVLGLARRALLQDEGPQATPRLLLTGAVSASGWGALITLLLSVASDDRLRGMLFWLTGDLNGAGPPGLPLCALLAVLAAAMPAAPQLNVLLRGDATARSLGVDTSRLRLRVYLCASLATALAVTSAGTIGFVGLVVPHMLRLAVGNDQRILLPACVLGGGALVMYSDLAARTVAAPAQLPVGAITALIGVPAFLVMLLRRARS
jgi:iron complex transport system permease protein